MSEHYLEPVGVKNPFVDGDRALHPYLLSATGWEIAADSAYITLTSDEPCAEDDTFYTYLRDIATMVRNYPATREIFACKEDSLSRLSFKVPTVRRINQFGRKIFEGLRTTGIEAVQTEDVDSTPLERYVPLIFEDLKLPIAYGHEPYLHDIVGHYLGAAAIEESEFVVLKTLRGVLPDEAMAEVFDTYTEYILLRLASKAPVSDDKGYLINHCVNYISDEYPELLEEATDVMRQIDLPRDRLNVSGHYEQVRERLRSTPHMPLQF